MKKFLTIVLLTMLLCVVGLTGCVNTEELELVKSDLQTQITALESITATDEELESAVSTAKSELQAQLDALNQTYATDEELESAIDTAKSALTEQTNSIKTALETTIADLKTELQGKIDTLTNTTAEKDSELEQAIKTAKETLEGQIALLNTTHNADIETLVNSINSAKAELTAQINTVKTELEATIADLKTELQGKIDTLTNTTAEKDSELEQAIKTAIESLQAQITALENVIYKDISEINLTLNLINQTLGTTIAKIEYDELGRLVITLTNGTVLEPLEMPEIHKYGDWIVFSGDNATCEDKIYYHECEKCNKLEFKKGSYDDHKWDIETINPTCQSQGYDIYTCSTCNLVEYRDYVDILDHVWGKDYVTDNSFHWIKCKYCEEIKGDKIEHTADDSGYCIVCNGVVHLTRGIIIVDNNTTTLPDLSVDGTIVSVKDLNLGTEYLVEGAIAFENNTNRVITYDVIITTDTGAEYTATIESYTEIIDNFEEFNQIFGYQSIDLTVTQSVVKGEYEWDGSKAVLKDAEGNVITEPEVVWSKTLSTTNAEDVENYINKETGETFKLAYQAEGYEMGVVPAGYSRAVDTFTLSAITLTGSYVLGCDLNLTEEEVELWDPYKHVDYIPKTFRQIFYTGSDKYNQYERGDYRATIGEDGTESKFIGLALNVHLGDLRKFEGTFNGNGHVISGMVFDDTDRGGFFGITDGAVIKNVGFTNVTFAATHGSVIGGKNVNTETVIDNVLVEVVSWVADGSANRSGALYQNSAQAQAFTMTNSVVIAPKDTVTTGYANGALWSQPSTPVYTKGYENVVVISKTQWLGRYANFVCVAENSTYIPATKVVAGINHYADFAEAISAGKTQIGSWVITAEGITWGE